jgi:hypothetical protein
MPHLAGDPVALELLLGSPVWARGFSGFPQSPKEEEKLEKPHDIEEESGTVPN